MKRYFNHEINNEMPFDLISVFHRNTFTSVNVTKTNRVNSASFKK